MEPWKLIFSESAMHALFSLRRSARRDVERLLNHLKDFPNDAADADGYSREQRWFSVKWAGEWAVHYWLDGRVKEVRVVDIKKHPRSAL